MTESNVNLEPNATVDLNGRFKIDIVSDAVYLAVFPPQAGGQAVAETMVVNQLKFRGIKHYHYQQVANIVQEAAGSSVKIAEISASDLQEDRDIQITVTDDQMEAWLALDPDLVTELTFNELLEKLQERGVTYGLNYNEIQIAYEQPGKKVKCAQGLMPENGSDAQIRFFVDFENKGKPKVLEDGKVDYKDTGMYVVIGENETLAEKFPATMGTPGIDVFGQQIPARAGRDVQLPLGKNTLIKDNKLISIHAGQVIWDNEKINVIPVIDIPGDVDLSTGNITFNGNVIIKGSVHTGFYVRSTGDVEINGSINGGTVEARNVIVRMGIQGMEKGIVRATEDVTAKFIENADVQAGRDIKVNGVILHSDVCAGRSVTVEGRKGLIAGGTVIAGEEIKVRNVGTPLAITTDLQVGVNPLMREEYHRLKSEYKDAEVNLQQAQKALTLLRSLDQAGLPPEKRELLLKTTKMQFTLAGQLEGMRNRIAEIELAFEDMRYGKIKASDYIYPGTRIMIGSLVRLIKEVHRFATFYAENGEIKLGSYR